MGLVVGEGRIQRSKKAIPDFSQIAYSLYSFRSIW
jgi:hypothetical protein